MNSILLEEPPMVEEIRDLTPGSRTRSWVPAQPRVRSCTNEWAIRGICNLGAMCNYLWPGNQTAEGRFGILMYHRMTEEVPGIPRPSLNVPPAHFDAQISGLLEAGYAVWPLRRVLKLATQGQPVPPRTVVLTFDDGFENIYQSAWPVLKKYNVPATVFVATSYLDSLEPFPFDHWGLEHAATAPSVAYRPISHAQCRELVECPLVELAAHTHTHQDFRHRPQEFQKDLMKSVGCLRDEFGMEDVCFSFPYGTPRLGFSDTELREAARQTGVTCGLTTGPELVAPGSDPFTWGRFNVFRWDTAATIAAKLEGWYSWAPKQKRRFFQWLGSSEAEEVQEEVQVEVQAQLQDGKGLDVCRRPTSTTASRGKLERPLAEKDLVSVVVPTYNRADWLLGALHSLTGIETDDTFDYEVIVVDNASADHTREAVASFARQSSVPVRYYFQENPGDAPTRNEGVRQARGNWLAFFDDDQFAEPGWVKELLKAARLKNAKVVGGPVHLDMSDAEAERLGVLCRRALREVRFHSRLHPYTRKQLPGTGNALVARSVFSAIGLFDETMKSGGSDSDFFKRARQHGYQLWYTPHAVIRHRIPERRLTAEYFRWDALAGGAGTARFDAKERGRLALLWLGLLRVCHSLSVHVPRMTWAWICRRPGDVTGHCTNLWRTEAYLRQAAAILVPSLLPQTGFFQNLEFRNARSIGTHDSTIETASGAGPCHPSQSPGEVS